MIQDLNQDNRSNGSMTSGLMNEEVQMIMGTSDGQIFGFDPVLRSKLMIKNYHYEQDKSCFSVEIVKWLDSRPTPQGVTQASKSSQGPIQSRFLVVYSDGSISFFHKDKDVPQNLPNTNSDKEQKYDYDKDMIRLPQSGQSVSKG